MPETAPNTPSKAGRHAGAGRTNHDKDASVRSRSATVRGVLVLALATSAAACRDDGWTDLPVEPGPVAGGEATGGTAGRSIGTAGAGGWGGVGGFGGFGGFAGVGGQAGGTQVADACDYPETTFDPGSWQPDQTPRTLDAALAHLKSGFPGHWQGVVTTPWVPPYDVTLTFGADGSYSGACRWSSNMCCVAFYYGTDDDTSLKQYALDTVTAAGVVGGPIDIIYDYQAAGYAESGYQGDLRRVELDATGNRLRFEFWYGGQYGPLKFDLVRAAP